MEENYQHAMTKAIDYLKAHGRPLDQALYACLFEGGKLDVVLSEMEKFRNADGGFGHGYEPDLQCPDSSALCTTEALQTCWKLGLDASHFFVQGAVEWLLDNYVSDARSWHFIPQTAMDYPRAPWWQYDSNAATYKHNPRAEILGILWRAREYVSGEILEEVTESVLADFESEFDTLQMHDLYCYLRLVRTPDLRADIHDRLMKHLPALIEKHVDSTEEAWAGYGIRPYAIAQKPDDPFYPLVADTMPQAVAYLLEEQSADGSWPLTWNWGENYPEVWPKAENEWKSRGTLENMILLKLLR